MDVVNITPFIPAWFVTKFDPRAFSLVVLVKGTFRLADGKPLAIAPEQQPPTGDLHVEDNPERALLYGFDFAPWKPKADVILSATAWAPASTEAAFVDAELRVGSIAKRLRVSGDRYWLGRSDASQPKPFRSMPVSWERAFGGPGFAWNPLGRGNREVLLGDEVKAYPVPNVESPTNLQRKRAEKLPPAGFGPIPSTWPQRADKAGKCDKNYLKERWPYYPDSFDWAHFNQAPEDQQVEGYLKGDEEVLFRNLHPECAELRTRLPGLRIRAFLNERLKARQHLREVPLRLDTFWADPGAGLAILVWRGNAQVRSEKLLEITNLLVADEKLQSSPLPLPAYEPILLQASLADEEEEEPEEVEAASDDDEEQELDAQETEVAKAGAEPGTAAEASPAGQGAPAESGAAEQQPDEQSGAVTDTDVDETEPGPDEALTLPQVRQMLAVRSSFHGRDLSGLDLSGLDFSNLDLAEAILEGALLERANLSGANLSGALLGQSNLSRAQCLGTNFRESDLTGAWLDEAILEGAILAAADLTGASLRRANLRRANAAEAILCEADLSDAVLERANLNAADLCDARLHRANLREADLAEAALERAWGREVSAEGARFSKLRAASCRLPGANFSRGVGEEAVWEMSELAGADFSGAVMPRAEFSAAFLADASFDGAELRDARLVEARLPRARLRRTNLFGASLDKADLSAADIAESNLYEATLMDADVRGTNFQSANLRRVRMRKE